jgi:hypothetical protein
MAIIFKQEKPSAKSFPVANQVRHLPLGFTFTATYDNNEHVFFRAYCGLVSLTDPSVTFGNDANLSKIPDRQVCDVEMKIVK